MKTRHSSENNSALGIIPKKKNLPFDTANSFEIILIRRAPRFSIHSVRVLRTSSYTFAIEYRLHLRKFFFRTFSFFRDGTAGFVLRTNSSLNHWIRSCTGTEVSIVFWVVYAEIEVSVQKISLAGVLIGEKVLFQRSPLLLFRSLCCSRTVNQLSRNCYLRSPHSRFNSRFVFESVIETPAKKIRFGAFFMMELNNGY